MIGQVLKTATLSFVIGLAIQLSQGWLHSEYFSSFLKGNLINLLAALLAINCATLGIVLTKIRDLVDKYGGEHEGAFDGTRRQMLLSIKEQVALIGFAVVFLTLAEAKVLAGIEYMPLLLNAAVAAVFVYAICVLYDTAKSVFVILDF